MTAPRTCCGCPLYAKGTATLPKNWVTALASGSAKGLAIYASGSSDYMAVTGGQITITFS